MYWALNYILINNFVRYCYYAHIMDDEKELQNEIDQLCYVHV